MRAAQLERHFVAVMAKHLPPSPSRLELLDLGGRAGAHLSRLRHDLAIRPLSRQQMLMPGIKEGSIDAIAALNQPVDKALLAAAVPALRPGGRFIAVQSSGAVNPAQPRLLRECGFVRILVEPALDDIGVLLRGEKAHATADTVKRIRATADRDAPQPALAGFKGRYLHLLIQQRPNKPAWKLDPAETVTWRAAAVQSLGKPVLLAFSSLPKAVAFLQRAVLADGIRDINKIGKFSRSTARTWDWESVLNPTLESIAGEALTLLPIDPATAEAPDE